MTEYDIDREVFWQQLIGYIDASRDSRHRSGSVDDRDEATIRFASETSKLRCTS
jgi:hypothetical protein